MRASHLSFHPIVKTAFDKLKHAEKRSVSDLAAVQREIFNDFFLTNCLVCMRRDYGGAGGSQARFNVPTPSLREYVSAVVAQAPLAYTVQKTEAQIVTRTVHIPRYSGHTSGTLTNLTNNVRTLTREVVVETTLPPEELPVPAIDASAQSTKRKRRDSEPTQPDDTTPPRSKRSRAE